MIVMPSLLAAPSLSLHQAIEDLIKLGFHTFHIDMMDYHFTPNFGLSTQICKDILQAFPQVKLDVHLMTNPTPQILLEDLASLGIDQISVHQNLSNIPPNFRIALNPLEPFSHLQHKKLLFLTVSPGFSFQQMKKEVLLEAKKAKENGHNITIDGGINLDNLDEVLAINPDQIVIGGGLFGKDRQKLLDRLMDLPNLEFPR